MSIITTRPPRQPLPASMRKYWVGEQVSSLQQVIDHAQRGGWFFFHTTKRPTHPSWVTNQQVQSLQRAINSKQVWLAKRNPDFPYVFRALWMHHRVNVKLSEWWAICPDLQSVQVKAKNYSQLVARCQLAVPGEDSAKRFEVTSCNPHLDDF